MNQSAFNRNIWLLNTVYQAGPEGITYEEICKRWQESGLSKGKGYPLRSFHNHRKEIHDVFNVMIACKKSTNSYYVHTSGQADNFLTKLLGLISVNQLVNSKSEQQRIVPDMFPGGEAFLPTLSQAIAENACLKVEVLPWGVTHTAVYEKFQPYALKEYKNVWYLIGSREVMQEAPGQGPIQITQYEMLDLRCVKRIIPLAENFQKPVDAIVNGLLTENYGSKLEGIETQEIMLKVPAPLAAQLKWHPMHVSQREIEKRKNYTIMYMYLKPTADFVHDLLALGAEIEVLMPQDLKEKMVSEAKKSVRKNS